MIICKTNNIYKSKIKKVMKTLSSRIVMICFVTMCMFVQTVSAQRDMRTLSVNDDYMPKNPALTQMTAEERAVKYKEISAKDTLVLADGAIKKIRKTYPELIVFEYEQTGSNYVGNLTFTAIDGTVLTVEWERYHGSNTQDRHNCIRDLYNHKALRLERKDGEYVKRDLSLDYSELFLDACPYGEVFGKIETPKGDIIDLKSNGLIVAKIMDPKIKGDYKRYHNGVIDCIRKTLSDCTIETIYTYYPNKSMGISGYFDGQFRIEYFNGDVYTGRLKEHFGLGDGERASSKINKANSLADIGEIYDGQMIDKNNNIKLYVKGEYDEIESTLYTQRIQAREKKKKEEAQLAMKQKQTLINGYGQKNVNIVLNAKKISELLVIGMPMSLLIKASDANIIGLNFKLVRKSGRSECYEFYKYGFNYKKETLGYLWTDGYKISSVVYY